MTRSSINGRAAPLKAAIAEAARLISESRQTVITGLGADVAGVRAALLLADRIGGVVDHVHSAALLRDLDVLREHGAMLTTPGEARIRGDVLLLVGDVSADPALPGIFPDFKLPLGLPSSPSAKRRVIHLSDPATVQAATAARTSKASASIEERLQLPLRLIGAIRARVNGRPVALDDAMLREVEAVVDALKSATFGIAIWSAGSLDALTIEMLCGLVKDINANTRFAGLPLVPEDNAAGVLQTCAWMSGFPIRTSFAPGYPEHDPWTFDTDRMVDSGEADCALWISTYQPIAPRWQKPIATIALTNAGAEFAQAPAVHIVVGHPGVDHDCVEYSAWMGTLTTKSASHRTDAPSAAEVIRALSALLDDRERPLC
jgi:formylmethanofuran dehydrogenase subunit B